MNTSEILQMNRVAEETQSLHVCRDCGCIWRLWKGDAGWSLADEHQKPEKCCDNSPDFLSKLRPTPAAESLLPVTVDPLADAIKEEDAAFLSANPNLFSETIRRAGDIAACAGAGSDVAALCDTIAVLCHGLAAKFNERVKVIMYGPGKADPNWPPADYVGKGGSGGV